MKEKKVIDYTRTYRRIEADKKKCILYIVILILLGFLLIVYPGIQISLINTGISLGVIILLAELPWKGRPLAIYLILCSAIHLINSLWFVFGEKYFPYTLTVYSKLYMLQEIGICIC